MAQQFRDYRLRGWRQAKARGILTYRMITPPGRPDVRIRVAVTRTTGPRGGRTVATTILRRIGGGLVRDLAAAIRRTRRR